MKKEKGWRITVFEVTVKHRPDEPRKYMAMDLADRMRDYDSVKAARAKVKTRNPANR